MSDRQTTPDLLGELMTGIPVQAEKEENNKAIKQVNNKPVKKEVNTSSKQPSNKASEPIELEQEEDLKEKATFNLSVRVLEELEEKWAEIRKLTRSKQISKTLIVEEALKMVFSEYDTEKQESKLYSKLANHKAIKQ